MLTKRAASPAQERTPSPATTLPSQLAFYSTVNYREAYGLFACNGILFNHESPLRGDDFVTQKIVKGVAKLSDYGASFPDYLRIRLGNLDSQRDWGHAKDYVKGMWLMLQHEKQDDYVLATGETHSIRELLDICFNYIGVKDWMPYIEIDPRLFRPAEVPALCANPAKAEQVLGWRREYTFHSLIKEMMHEALSSD